MDKTELPFAVNTVFTAGIMTTVKGNFLETLGDTIYLKP